MIGRTITEIGLYTPEQAAVIATIVKKHHTTHNHLLQFYTRSGSVRTGLFSAQKLQVGGQNYDKRYNYVAGKRW